MVNAPVRYFKGTRCGYCGEPVNDDKAILMMVDTHSNQPPERILHTSPRKCLDNWHKGGGEGWAATWDTVELSERPSYEDIAAQGFYVQASPTDIGEKLVEFSDSRGSCIELKVGGVEAATLAKLSIKKKDMKDMVSAHLFYVGTGYTDVGTGYTDLTALIDNLMTDPTFYWEALLIKFKSKEATYVIPSFGEPINKENMVGLGLKVVE